MMVVQIKLKMFEMEKTKIQFRSINSCQGYHSRIQQSPLIINMTKSKTNSLPFTRATSSSFRLRTNIVWRVLLMRCKRSLTLNTPTVVVHADNFYSCIKYTLDASSNWLGTRSSSHIFRLHFHKFRAPSRHPHSHTLVSCLAVVHTNIRTRLLVTTRPQHIKCAHIFHGMWHKSFASLRKCARCNWYYTIYK